MSELRRGANAEASLQLFSLPISLARRSFMWVCMYVTRKLQHVRAYGLTDDVDESDGHDLLLKSDQRPQVRQQQALHSVIIISRELCACASGFVC